jgi:hypothetical protein
MSNVNAFGPCIRIANTIDVEQRHDVLEFLVCFAPLLTCKKTLPDTSWTAMLSLLGVADVTGEIVSDTECVMCGIMSTHPPLRARVRLSMQLGQPQTRYNMTSIDISEHVA